MKHLLYFVRMIRPCVPKAAVQEMVRNCDKCQSIDSAPVHWKISRLDMGKDWIWVGMDTTHFEGQHYLALPDRLWCQFGGC